MNKLPPISKLKREAKELVRSNAIPLHQALDQIAQQNGFSNWSVLSRYLSKSVEPKRFADITKAGDMVLCAGRPQNGKTQLAVKVMHELILRGWQGVFLTLEYTAKDLLSLTRRMGIDFSRLGDRFVFDDSDRISASYVCETYARSARPSIFVVDFLQILDQDRSKPSLQEQILQFRQFVNGGNSILLFLSQIDRTFEMSDKVTPDRTDIRLPNPLELGLFDHVFFAKDGKMDWE